MKGKNMKDTLSPIEVMEVAQQIERNGAAFYNKAAEIFDEPTPRALFLALAEREIEHEMVFADMQKLLTGDEPAKSATRERDDLASPKAIAGLAVFGITHEPTEQLAGDETLPEIIKMALAKEKDSIVFYTGLKGFVTDDKSIETINDIIQEEMRHIRILSENLAQI
jgi:rubrerythrin